MKVKEIFNIFDGEMELTNVDNTIDLTIENISKYENLNVTYIDSDYKYLLLYVDEVIK